MQNSYEGLESLEEEDQKHDPRNLLDNNWESDNTKKGIYKNNTKDTKDTQNVQNSKTIVHGRNKYFNKNTSSRIVHELAIQEYYLIDSSKYTIPLPM